MAGEKYRKLVSDVEVTDWLNVRSRGAVGDGVTDDRAAIQQAIDDCPVGGTVYLPGATYGTGGPLVVPPGKTLRGARANLMAVDGLFNPQTCIRPLAAFTGVAAIRFLDQASGGYSALSGEQRILDVMLDGSNVAAGVDGIQAKGAVQNVGLRDVTIKAFPNSGIYCGLDNNLAPYSWRMTRVMLDSNHAHGMYAERMVDLTLEDCQAIGNWGTGFTLINAANSQINGSRAEWSGNHGLYLSGDWGTGAGSGGIMVSGFSTDRNGFNGVYIDATGSAPIVVNGLMTRRDGRNGGPGGGGYAGLAVKNATMPVVVGGWINFPGVDDGGTGSNSPQYGASVTGSAHVQIDNAYLHADTAGLYNGGGNTTLRLGANITYATGPTTAPARAVQQTFLDQATADGRYPQKASLVMNVKDRGAAGDNTADDTAALQGAIDAVNAAGGGTLFLPRGTYLISAALAVPSSVVLQGDGMNITIIRQSSTTAAALSATDKRYIVIRDLQLKGPNSGTGRGIDFRFSASPLASLSLTNLIVTGFGGDGVHLETPITSAVTNVRSQGNGGHGFFQSSGTSVTWEACYANGNTGNGWELDGVNYSALNACGSDSNAVGYAVNGSSAIVFNGCGSEVCQVGFKILGGSANISLLTCKVQTQTQIGFWITNASTFCFLLGCREASPNGATAAIQVDAGSQATVINPQNTTANNLAAGTANLFQSTNLEVHSSGNSVARVSRGAVTNTGRYTLQTANSDRWTMGLSADSTDNWHLTDLAHTTDAIVAAYQAGQPNLGLLTGSGAPSYGGGVGVTFLANATTAPTANPAGGALFYAEGGVMKVRQPDGTTVALANGLPSTGGTVNGNLFVTGNALGQDTPAAHGAAAWCYDPALAVNSTELVKGSLYLTRVNLAAAANLTKLYWWVANAAVTPTAGQSWIGLYRSDGVLLGSTAADTDMASAGLKTSTIASQAMAAGAFCWVGLLFNASVPPTLTRASGWTGVGAATSLGLTAATYRFAINGTGRTALPASFTPASNVATDFAGPWVAVG